MYFPSCPSVTDLRQTVPHSHDLEQVKIYNLDIDLIEH